MTTRFISFPLALLACLTLNATAAVRYVNGSNPTPVSPYTSWATAATNIQQAIDAASAGDQILVTNGVYQTGGRVVYGALSNRVAITAAVTVQSVNGPAVTAIKGSPAIGNNAVRCVYLTNGAVLSGFTLSDGATRSLGDVVQERYGGGVWSESTNALVSNCVLTSNRAGLNGGGAYRGTFSDCVLVSNSVSMGMTAAFCGGGACGSVLIGCTLTGNAGAEGGGACSSTLSNCWLNGNSAASGGGVESCTAINCAIWENTAATGAGASGSVLHNCTITANAASSSAGGTSGGTLRNCIVYYNSAPSNANYSGGTLDYSCTTPLPSGSGNRSVAPQLADLIHLSTGSPCRGAGSAAYAGGLDIDGETWANPPSMGCDEYTAGAITGPLTVSIQAGYTNVPTGFAVAFAGQVAGHPAVSRWDFGDGTALSNQLISVSHSWATQGVYTVELRAYNETYPAGVSAALQVHVANQVVHYVALTGTNPVAPYLTWDTAATNIQDAVDAAYVQGTVLVSNGVYQTGGRVVNGALTNRVAVTKPLALQSVNGPAVTVIQGRQVAATTNGDGAIRCVYLTNGVRFSGFTLTQGATCAAGDQVLEQSGGGLWCASNTVVVSNCIFAANSANRHGGGTYQGTLQNCTLTCNYSALRGAAAASAVLVNCLLATNSAGYAGGGAYASTLTNCSISGCAAVYSAGATESGSLVGCVLAGNRSQTQGGAANGGILSGCTLIGNSSPNGGGIASGTLNNCLLVANAGTDGGGAWYSTLNQCTVVSNSAANSGGGAHGSTLNNCILRDNSAPAGDNYADGTLQQAVLNYCCTTPQPTNGTGNFDSPPVFVDPAGGNLRLQSNSPCINTGNNAYVVGDTDLDGRPRIKDGTVDIGAYEFQEAGMGEFIAWLQQYGLPANGSADYADSDGDHLNNWQEWRTGTVPTNAASVLQLLPPTHSASGLKVTWQSVTNVTYFLDRSTDLGAQPAFSTIQSNLAGQAGTTSYTDTTATNGGPCFYRVGVQ
jgi:hypothetical protein